MKSILLAVLTLALSAGYARAEEPETTTTPDPSTVELEESTCTVFTLGDYTVGIGCSQEELDSIRARGSGGTF